MVRGATCSTSKVTYFNVAVESRPTFSTKRPIFWVSRQLSVSACCKFRQSLALDQHKCCATQKNQRECACGALSWLLTTTSGLRAVYSYLHGSNGSTGSFALLAVSAQHLHRRSAKLCLKPHLLRQICCVLIYSRAIRTRHDHECKRPLR
jgi:hypothetical protein